jgi:hypothetical protein
LHEDEEGAALEGKPTEYPTDYDDAADDYEQCFRPFATGLQGSGPLKGRFPGVLSLIIGICRGILYAYIIEAMLNFGPPLACGSVE